MPRFFIELQHDSDPVACAQAARIILKTGNHFLTNADFGCLDGDHAARIIMEMESKDDARAVLPTEYRNNAKITRLNKFKLEKVEEFLRQQQIKASK